MAPFRDQPMQCPRCGKQLSQYADRAKWRCKSCNGVLVGADELVVEIGPQAKGVLDNDADPDRPAIHPCPVCAFPMTPYTIGKTIELDRCQTDRMVWFDGGEIGKVRAAIPAENDDAPLIDDTRSFLAKVQAEDDEAGWSKIPLAEPQAPMTSEDWKARTVCSDGACNGVIENGACTVCGKPATAT